MQNYPIKNEGYEYYRISDMKANRVKVIIKMFNN